MPLVAAVQLFARAGVRHWVVGQAPQREVARWGLGSLAPPVSGPPMKTSVGHWV